MSKIDAKITHDGDPPFVWIAEIKRELVDGLHVFTSEKIPGLIVTAQTMEKAVKQLPLVIEELISRNDGLECEVTLGSHAGFDTDDHSPDVAVITKKAA